MQAINQVVKDFMSIFENGLQQAAIRGKVVIMLGSELNCNFLAKRNNTLVEFKQLKGLLRSENLRACLHGVGDPGLVGYFCFHALGDTKQKKLTPLDRGPPLHVNRVLVGLYISLQELLRILYRVFSLT